MAVLFKGNLISDNVRRRRTAEESRINILDVAARRLREHGMDGLNITGVAEEAGISHATLLHHFGSSSGMREALAARMTHALVLDLLEALNGNASVEELLSRVFHALSGGKGHAELIAWRALEGGPQPENVDAARDLFDQLLESSRNVAKPESRDFIRQIVYLVATSAIGHGLTGNSMSGLFGLSEDDVENFPVWMSNQLSK